MNIGGTSQVARPRMSENAVFSVALVRFLLEQSLHLAGFCINIDTPVGGVGRGPRH